MRHAFLMVFGVLLLTDSSSAPAVAVENPLSNLQWLQGHWVGQGDGQPGPATLSREIVCALDCRYLNVEAQYRRLTNNPDGEYSTALAMWSYHPGQQRLRLHSFDDFAALTTYIEVPESSVDETLVLVSENRFEGGRARFIYTFIPPDAFTERFEVAPHGQDWQLYVESRFERVAPPLALFGPSR